MKRYIKLISFVSIIIVTIGTFYIQSSLAITKYPEFVIKTKTGDSKEVEGLSISAMLNNEWQLSIDQTGSTYDGIPSYFKKMQYVHQGSAHSLKQLRKDHRQFMRGKDSSPVLYFDNEQMLAYVNIAVEFKYDQVWKNEYTFEISTLNKGTNKTRTANIQVPEGGDYESVHIQAVQVVDDELKIVTGNYKNDPSMSYQILTEPHVYTVALDTMMITDDEKIVAKGNLPQDEWFDSRVIFHGDGIGEKQFIGFEAVQVKIKPDENGNGQLEMVGSKFVIYNFQTGDQTTLEIPEEYEQSYDAKLMNENTLYLGERTDDTFKIVTYDLIEHAIVTKQSFDLPVELSPHGFNIHVENGKVYIYSYYKPQTLDAILRVGDIATGDVLFEGTIEQVENKKLDETYELLFYGLLFE